MRYSTAPRLDIFSTTSGANLRTSFAFLNPSLAPAGTTAMLSAKDLATFALAHVNDGVALNGHRLLSAASARRMRQQTAAWRGVGGGGFGLGWMTIDKDILGHDGGGPGIASWLYVDPAAKTVAAVLTNAATAGASRPTSRRRYTKPRAPGLPGRRARAREIRHDHPGRSARLRRSIRVGRVGTASDPVWGRDRVPCAPEDAPIRDRHPRRVAA